MTKSVSRPAWLTLLALLLCARVVPVQAQISFRAAGVQTVGTGSSITPAIPAGAQASDFAVLIIAGRPSNATEPVAPAGWTLRSSSLREVGSNDLKVMTFYRVLAGADANPTVTLPTAWQGNSAGMSGQIAVWSGVSATSSFDAADVTGNAAALASWTPPAISTVTAGAWVVSAVATSDDNALGLGTPQGFTGRMTGTGYDSTTGGDHSVGLADKLQATPGAPPMSTWNQTTHASDLWASITFALRPNAVAAPAGLYYIHPDHLNTPRQIYNDQQQLVWRWDQAEPFGVSVPDENPAGVSTFEFLLRFPGQYADKETNLAYNYFRDFDPGLGRYIQSDPIGLQGGVNTYSYVDSSPLRLIDPLGLQGDTLDGGTARPPGIGLPNPSAEAQRQLARQIIELLKQLRDKLCEPQEPCDPPEGTRCWVKGAGKPHGGYSQHWDVYEMQRRRSDNVCFWAYRGGKFGEGVLVTPPPATMRPCSDYPNFTPRPPHAPR